MKYGICIGSVDSKKLSYIKSVGYDYVELNFKKINALSENNFIAAQKTINETGIAAVAANSFLPSYYKLASNDFDKASMNNYLEKGLKRANLLGIQTIVFGSGGARSIPKDMDYEKGWANVVDFLKDAAKIAEKYNITIVIEPLAPFECNLVNTVKQSAKLAADTLAENVKAHADFFHMAHAKDNVNNITEISGRIAHSHISNPKTRMFPKSTRQADYKSYISALKNCGVETCSVEGWAVFFKTAARKAIKLLKSI